VISRKKNIAGLKGNRGFQNIPRQGKKYNGPCFQIFWIEKPENQQHKIGLQAKRKTAGAVQRNRAKRMLREALRAQLFAPPPGREAVIYLKPEIYKAELTQLRSEIQKWLKA